MRSYSFDLRKRVVVAVESKGAEDAVISPDNKRERFRGSSRFGDWREEFRGLVADLQNGRGDELPNLSILRLSNDHTAGLRQGVPTPQFYVAENDCAVGKLVEEVLNSPYWKDTAIFVVGDDAQDDFLKVRGYREIFAAKSRTPKSSRLTSTRCGIPAVIFSAADCFFTNSI